MPTEFQRSLIQQSLERLRSKLPEVSQDFYRRLFELDPSVEALFANNDTAKQTKFINMLSTLSRAKHLDTLVVAMQQLGERHLHYGATPFQFPAVRQALMDALALHLGAFYNDEVTIAWEDFFDTIGQMMRDGMQLASKNNPEISVRSHAYEDSDLMADIGDEAVIKRVHTRFYDWIFEDAWLGKFFWAKSKDVLIKHQTEFMVSCFGGPNHFDGETPAIAHMHMVITDEMFSLRQHHLRKAILAEGLSESIADRWIAVDNAFRKAMIRTDASQCVMRCMGQMPIETTKPANYPWPEK